VIFIIDNIYDVFGMILAFLHSFIGIPMIGLILFKLLFSKEKKNSILKIYLLLQLCGITIITLTTLITLALSIFSRISIYISEFLYIVIGLFLFLQKKDIRSILFISTIKQFVEKNYREIIIVIIIFSFAFISRIIFFWIGPIGPDTFRPIIVSKQLFKFGNLEKSGGILGLYRLLPDSVFIGETIILLQFYLHSPLGLISSIFPLDVYLISLASLSIFVLSKEYSIISKKRDDHFAFFLSLFYQTIPVVYKFTNGFYSGRTYIFVFIPMMLLFLFFCDFRFKYYFLLFQAIILMPLFHRTLLFNIIIISFYFLFQRIDKVKHISNTQINKIILITIVSLIVLLILPLILWIFKVPNFVFIWFRKDVNSIELVFNLEISFSIKGFFSLILLYSLWFLFREGILFFFSIIFFPLLLMYKNRFALLEKKMMIVLLFASLPLVIFIYRAMYFYQALLPIQFLLAVPLLYKANSFINNKYFHYKKKIKIFLKIITIIFLLFPGLFIESYRIYSLTNFVDNNKYLSKELEEVKDYFSRKLKNEDVILTSSASHSMILGSFLDNIFIPTSFEIYRYYGYELPNYTINKNNKIYLRFFNPLIRQENFKIDEDLNYLYSNTINDSKVIQILTFYNIHYILIDVSNNNLPKFFMSIHISNYSFEWSNNKFIVYSTDSIFFQEESY